MDDLFRFLLTLLSQFAGGPGPVENNLVRFGLAAVFWAVLFFIAWSRQRSGELPREKLLVWGFGLALVRELYMFGQTAWRVIDTSQAETSCNVTEPLEHALAMVAVVVVSGAFLRYMLDDTVLATRFLQVGLCISSVVLITTAIVWPPWLAATPSLKFHQTWLAWLFHLPLSLMILVTIYYLWKKPGWLRNVVTSALILYFLSEVLFLLNYATGRSYATVLCPLGNSFHILAIPLLGFVYLREQSLEKEKAEAALSTYRDHLEDLVKERTTELTQVNERLRQEVFERRQAEEALARITDRDELILTSAGEGICGIDRQGCLIFVNPAAAAMLGYQVGELVNQSFHAVWHCYRADGTLYPEVSSPIYTSYQLGETHNKDDEFFCRKDGALFPVRYVSSPSYEKGELAGAVVVFRDITERKRSEMELARRNVSLAIQNAVAAGLSQSLDVEVSLKLALDMMLESLSMQVGLIFLWDTDRKNLNLRLYRGNAPFEEVQALVDKHTSCWQITERAAVHTQAQTLFASDDGVRPIGPVETKGTLNCFVSTPLISKGRSIGAMTLGSSRQEPIGQHSLDLLTAIGQQVGMAIENARMYQDAERWAVNLTRLQETSAQLVSSLDEERIKSVVVEQSTRLMNCQMACVLRWDEQTMRLAVAGTYGMDAYQERVINEPLNSCDLFFELARTPRLISIQNVQDDMRVPGIWLEQIKVKAFLCLPVWGADHPLMYLCLFDITSTRSWNPQELELIESFAARAAVGLMNARLHKQLEMAAALEERQRIAAEMHDGLAQTLGLLGLRVDQVADRVADDPDQAIASELQVVREVVTQASAEIRRSISSLRDAPKVRIPLQDQLAQMVERNITPELPKIEFVNRLSLPLFLSKRHLQQVLPLLQEAVLNARNHARATTIRILLEALNGEVHASVEDDGVGFDPNALADVSNHFGLSIMQARAERVGGRLRIDSDRNRGTCVSLVWKPETDGAPRQANESETKVGENSK